MKLHYKLLVKTILSLCIMVAYSCGGNEIEPVPTPPQPDKVTLSTQSLTVKATETSASLTITSNRTWNASSDQPWCTLSESSGEAGTTTITLTLSTNTTNKERTATLTFKAGTATASVTIKQKEEESEIELDNMSLNVGSDTGTANLKLTTNKDWTATSDQSWCKLSATEGESGSKELTITYEANPDEMERTATLTFKAGSATATVIVKQEGEVAKIELDNTSLNVGSNAGTANLKLTTNKNWTATSNQSWCKLSATEGESGSKELAVTYEENPDETERTAIITIKAGTATATITMKQEKKEAKIELDNTSFNVGSNAGTVNLKMTTNMDWTATSNQNWCKLSATEGKSGSSNFTISYDTNPNEAERTATITIKAGTATVIITLKQEKKEVEPKIELNSTSFKVDSDTGSIKLNITSNKDWTAVSDQDWCKLSTSEGKAGSNNFTIIYEANPNETDRMATITIKASTATVTVSVKQKRKVAKIDLNNNSFDVGTDAGFVKLAIITNMNWTATSDQYWCKLSTTEGKAGSFDLTITYDANDSEKVRTAVITIKSGMTTSSVIVKQTKKNEGNGGNIQGLPNIKWE